MLKLDRLLDTKYSKEELAEMISHFSVDQEVKFTPDCLAWIKENAYYMHTIGGKQENGVITKDSAEVSLFIDLFIGNGYPYKAVIVDLLADVGDKLPGARVKITLPNGTQKITIQSVLDLL